MNYNLAYSWNRILRKREINVFLFILFILFMLS